MELWFDTIASHKFSPLTTDGFGFVTIPQTKFTTSSTENIIVSCKVEYQVTTWVPSYGKHSDLATDISRVLTSMINGDVTFVVGDKKFPAHKIIVGARSQVFAAMLQNDMKEAAPNLVEIVDIEPNVFQALLHFIYTDQVDLTIEMSKSFLAAANRYFLDLLNWKCETFLTQNLTLENFSELFILADTHNAALLKDSVVNLIRKSPTEVMKTDEWKKLKKSHPGLACDILETVFPSP